MPPLPRIERTSAADQVEHALRERILAGDFPTGSRLPAERPLSEQLGVNRVTLRSALARLTAAGLVEARHGHGYVVRDFLREGGPRLLGELARKAGPKGRVAIVADLLLVRRQLARAVFEKLADGVSPRSMAAIESLVDGFSQLVEDGAHAEALAEADHALLREVIDATGSRVLALCLNPVLAVVDEIPGLAAAIYADPEARLSAWRFLLDWLRTPDAAAIEGLVDTIAARDALTIARFSPRRAAGPDA